MFHREYQALGLSLYSPHPQGEEEEEGEGREGRRRRKRWRRGGGRERREGGVAERAVRKFSVKKNLWPASHSYSYPISIEVLRRGERVSEGRGRGKRIKEENFSSKQFKFEFPK